MMRLARRLAAKAGVKEQTQHGAAVIIVAASMMVLLGFAAFSIDFGWLYLNGVRIQHGADAAALSGVVYEPGDQTTAYSEARNSAAENGYIHGAAGTTVTPVDYAEDPLAVDSPYQLRVTVDHNVDTFFMRLFGVDSISMTRTAVAEYVLPLPMGSDLPYFGEDPATDGREPHFWANIHGYYTGREMGDRYSSQCDGGGAGSSCTENPERRATTYSDAGVPITGGYVYGIELDDSASGLTVEVFDGPFYEDGHDFFLAGDNPQGADSPHTWFILYAPDPTPLNTSDNEVLCSWRADPEMSPGDFDGDGDVGWYDWGTSTVHYDLDDDLDGDGDVDWDDFDEPGSGFTNGAADLWHNLCLAPDRGAGVYPLRVVTDAADEQGLNRFSLRASTSGGSQPRVYGLGDMSVYVNFADNEATLDLAEVQPVHAGKDMVIELWDPDSGNAGTEIIMPDGILPSCSWNKIGQSSTDLINCDINYATNTFHNSQLEIRVHIPEDYTCSTDCWWQIKVTYPGGANDTTTWSAHIEGNPVSLVE